MGIASGLAATFDERRDALRPTREESAALARLAPPGRRVRTIWSTEPGRRPPHGGGGPQYGAVGSEWLSLWRVLGGASGNDPREWRARAARTGAILAARAASSRARRRGLLPWRDLGPPLHVIPRPLPPLERGLVFADLATKEAVVLPRETRLDLLSSRLRLLARAAERGHWEPGAVARVARAWDRGDVRLRDLDRFEAWRAAYAGSGRAARFRRPHGWPSRMWLRRFPAGWLADREIAGASRTIAVMIGIARAQPRFRPLLADLFRRVEAAARGAVEHRYVHLGSELERAVMVVDIVEEGARRAGVPRVLPEDLVLMLHVMRDLRRLGV